MRSLLFGLIAKGFLVCLIPSSALAESKTNILFCIADDWGWPHSPLYGDEVVKTPTLERIAKNGVLFNYAYVSAPSCIPSRNAALTGQYHWRLKSGVNLWSQFP